MVAAHIPHDITDLKRYCRRDILTTTAYTLRGFRGPASHCSAGEDAGSVWQVTRVTAILQYGAHRKGAPVGFCEVYPAVLDHIWPHASWEVKVREEGTPGNCSRFSVGLISTGNRHSATLPAIP